MTRSQMAFILGVFGKVAMIAADAINVSRSRICSTTASS